MSNGKAKGAKMLRKMHARLVLLVVDEAGMSTVEYAIGSVYTV
ncbi:hypothetical protein MSP7336_01467 [Mycobacterium shimoidei]|uniref:Uncharacterized protein n=1 Tax=Mycobacterium shimoidei TaxID=29313 RepID=A0A375YWD4_MYCSH|nr:hypothetical protein [Mycobacterium shimoidei]SRX93231.1 hypothetical protein MSP7336_01467 [Mycobacterium shimoidei]